MSVSRKRRVFHDEDAMAAMNDIMFFLMLFFLIISTMANPNVIKVLLPKADNTQTVAKQPISLTVTEDMRYYLNTEEIAKDDLEYALTNAIGNNNTDRTVILRLAKDLTMQDLVDVLAIGVKLDLKMVLSTTR
ncbi:MAG: biopolymer transporter ExbD [Saprospiraceae bacterium]|nr:MAG: biopolymer transporter ExbD [Bacteroidetes bacterium OLB9]MCO6463684.1 biopolymer transporter ExbD [Saprospiraceae bacterium]MCZ2337043.1 biopolymer transporter ExbD [Chitinophagales bacterium]